MSFHETIVMKRAFRKCVLSAVCFLVCSTAPIASENALRAEGWSLSKLNPFKAKATPAASSREEDFDAVDFTDEMDSSEEEIESARSEDPLAGDAPEGLDEVGFIGDADDRQGDFGLGDESIFDDHGSAGEIAGERPKRAKPVKPSAWRRFTSGSKRMLTKTGEFLNPFDGKPAKKAPPKPLTGGQSYSGTRMTKKSEAKPSFFSSMTSWMKPEEEPKQTKTVTDFLGSPRPY